MQCTNFRRALVATIRPVFIRTPPSLSVTVLAMRDVFSLHVIAELSVAATNGGPVAHYVANSSSHRARLFCPAAGIV